MSAISSATRNKTKTSLLTADEIALASSSHISFSLSPESSPAAAASHHLTPVTPTKKRTNEQVDVDELAADDEERKSLHDNDDEAYDNESISTSVSKRKKIDHDPTYDNINDGKLREVFSETKKKFKQAPVNTMGEFIRGRASKKAMADFVKELDPQLFETLQDSVDPFLKHSVKIIIVDTHSDLLSITFEQKRLHVKRTIGTFSIDINSDYFAMGQSTLPDLVIKICGAQVTKERLSLLEWINMERIASRGTKQAIALGCPPYTINQDGTFNSATKPNHIHPKIDSAFLASICSQLMPNLNLSFEPNRE